MRSLRTLLVLTIIATVAANATAQDEQKKKKRGKGARLHPMVQAMTRFEMMMDAVKGMELNDDQKAKMGEVREGLQPKMEGMMKKVVEILGEEKMKEVSAAAKEAKDAGKNPRQVAMAVNAALKLNDEQSEKMTKIAKEVSAVQKDVLKKLNAMLTPEQKEKLKTAMAPRRGKNKKK